MLRKIIYINMKLKLKKEFSDVLIKSPIDGVLVHTLFLEEAQYIHWYNRKHGHIFDIVTEEKPIKKEKL